MAHRRQVIDDRPPVLWDRVALAGLITLAVILIIWWLESRFGSLVAILTFGGVLLVAVFVAGAWFNYTSTRRTLAAASEFIGSTSRAQVAGIGVQREYARMEREAFGKRAKLDVIDERRINQLAEQRAKLLISDQQSQQADNTEFWTDADIEYIEVE